jgi:hypothetical protein
MSLVSVTGNRPGYSAWHESGHAGIPSPQGLALDYETMAGTAEIPRHTADRSHCWLRAQKVLMSASGVISGFRSDGRRLGTTGIIDLLLGSSDDIPHRINPEISSFDTLQTANWIRGAVRGAVTGSACAT